MDYPVSELLDWGENTLKPKANLAFNGEGTYIPGSWCTFCKAAVKCRARADAKLKLAEYEFSMPALLSDAEIEDTPRPFGTYSHRFYSKTGLPFLRCRLRCY